MLNLKTILILIIGHQSLLAQEVIPATGGNAFGTGGAVSYSVGQITNSTYTGTNGTVTQGVQSAYEISDVTVIDEFKGIKLSVTIYPNPTADYLTLNIDRSDVSDLSYRLYDMQGKLLQNQKITTNQTSVKMVDYLTATYFLKITQGNRELRTYKIVKS